LEATIQGLLTAESAKDLITAAFPRFHGMQVEFLDEGWDFQVFEVDAEWLLRFPKREECAAKLSMECRLLPDLADWVSLPIPRYEYSAELHECLDQPFAGYKKLPGIAGDVSKSVDLHKVARQLGLFLTRLHAYPVDKAREAGVPERSDLVAHWRNKSCEQLNGIVDLNVDPTNLRRYLENDVPTPFEGALSLVHNDLWAEHILVDPRSGSVSGIIDWGDAAISDPAVDFACLYSWYGEKWLENVLANYSGTLDAEIIPRSRYLATCLAIHNITLGQELDRPQWIKNGQEALRLTFPSAPLL